jgi:rhodanese-related sulfurtransferase
MDFLSKIFQSSSIPQLDPAQIQDRLAQSPRPYLLDVRTPAEFREGHIQGAELIPLDELNARMSRLPKSREIICVCASGSRSSVAASHLSEKGYQVSNLRGGMARWARAGLPMKTGMK